MVLGKKKWISVYCRCDDARPFEDMVLFKMLSPSRDLIFDDLPSLCRQLKSRIPKQNGRVVVQDSPFNRVLKESFEIPSSQSNRWKAQYLASEIGNPNHDPDTKVLDIQDSSSPQLRRTCEVLCHEAHFLSATIHSILSPKL